jgi:hypothetical protein
MPHSDLAQAAEDLLNAAPAITPVELITRAEALRTCIEEALFEGGDPEATGLLNDAVVSLILHARAAQQSDPTRAEECLEQATLFLAAGTATERKREERKS